MFIKKTRNDFENFIRQYFPFYLDDYNQLTESEKEFLIKKNDEDANRGFGIYACRSNLDELSSVATGLRYFPICKDQRYYNSGPEVQFEKELTEKDSIPFYDRENHEFLLLMKRNPAAVTVFYIWYVFNNPVVEIHKDDLLRRVMNDKKLLQQAEDLGKDKKLDDYLRAIDTYFDEHPLKNISYSFTKDRKTILNFSCLAPEKNTKFEFERSELKYFIPMISYVDENWFEFCNFVFMENGLSAVKDAKKEESTSYKESLQFCFDSFCH